VHLIGVVGGSALRTSARRLEGEPPVAQLIGRRRWLLGRMLIGLGVLAWAPYLYLHYALGQKVVITPYLTAHLTGVLGGSALLASIGVSRYLARRAE
jgi:hypothetical protein